MSSAIINKIDPSAAFAALERAVAALEAATVALAGTITREHGGDFAAVRAVWRAQKALSTACRNAPLTGGDDLWRRVSVTKVAAENALRRSKRLAALAKRRRESISGARTPQRNEEFVFSSSNGERPRPAAYIALKAAKAAADRELRSRMKGPPRSLDQGHGKKK